MKIINYLFISVVLIIQFIIIVPPLVWCSACIFLCKCITILFNFKKIPKWASKIDDFSINLVKKYILS